MSNNGVFAGEFETEPPLITKPNYIGPTFVRCDDGECWCHDQNQCPICDKDDSEEHTCLAQD